MEYDLITFIQTLLGQGVKGYVISKPEGTPYPAFVVEDTVGRGMDLYGNEGKPFDYRHSIQVNLIGQKFALLSKYKEILLREFDGFSGVLGTHKIIDCRLNELSVIKNINKNYEFILLFTLSTE